MSEAQPPRTNTRFTVRAIDAHDLPWVTAELTRNWGATRISSLGVWHDAERLPGFIAVEDGNESPVGLLTHTPMIRAEACEVITLSARIQGVGVGSVLLDAFTGAARAAHCGRAFLTTTNDNLRAIAFYQKRAWALVALHRGAMDRARLVQPSIPTIGMNGIPLRDEIELEFVPDQPR